jgi:DNA-binding transcriptional ArsR family regulator
MESADPRAMRALTHPLRLDLMELLAANGPATAAACGRALGVPQANCSFHLRQLAKYGYVEAADPGADRRERRWRVAEARPSIRFGPESDGLVKRRLERLVVERETQAILDYVDRGDAEPRSGSAGLTAAIAALTAQEAAELKRKWRDLLEPYLVTARSVGAEPDGSEPRPAREHIRVFMAMTPMASMDQADQADQEDQEDQEESGHEHDD